MNPNPTHALADILADPTLNGVYRLTAAAAALPTLPPAALIDKAALLRGVAEALQFPADYGANWDALEDYLTDMEWWPGAIALHVADASRLPAALLDTLMQIFADAADYWREQGRPCSLFLSGLAPGAAPHLPHAR